MIEERFKLPVIDFVSRADEIPNLVGVVLYGSAVTGDISKKSDIDLLLLFDCDHDPELGREASIAHGISSDVSLKHDLAFPLSFVFATPFAVCPLPLAPFPPLYTVLTKK